MATGVSSFLREHRDEIVRSWETRVTSEQREVELVGLVLRDDVPTLLDALAGWLEGGGTVERSPVASEASKHVTQRLDKGLSLAQLLVEYRILRETIIEAVLQAEDVEQNRTASSGDAGRITRIKDLARLNAGLDVVLSRSLVEFASERERRKSQFLAVLSHELRNPLAPIRNSIYLLERAPSDSEQAKRARQVVRRQTEHLTRLIDDLLDNTRISHGKIRLERSRVDLREIVKKTTDDLHSIFTQASINLRVDHVTAGPMWVEADSTRMEQALTNLLNNSAKFTASGGTVRVSVAVRDGRAELSVTDDGAGIEAKDIEHLFEPFAQADQSMARSKGGLGLGLSLVKSIVELHGGTVAARSDGRGRGAEFVIQLPLAEAGSEKEAPRPREAVATPKTILVIEDNADGARSLADILELHGHAVRVARDGRSGIALARELKPDLILCDIGLPDVDGYEVARTLRRDGPLRLTRLVAVSGYAQPEDRQRSRDAGFDAHIPKPADLHEVLALVARDS